MLFPVQILWGLSGDTTYLHLHHLFLLPSDHILLEPHVILLDLTTSECILLLLSVQVLLLTPSLIALIAPETESEFT